MNKDQGENLEQSQNFTNGEFITDITKEARYKELEQQLENLELEKLQMIKEFQKAKVNLKEYGDKLED